MRERVKECLLTGNWQRARELLRELPDGVGEPKEVLLLLAIASAKTEEVAKKLGWQEVFSNHPECVWSAVRYCNQILQARTGWDFLKNWGVLPTLSRPFADKQEVVEGFFRDFFHTDAPTREFVLLTPECVVELDALGSTHESALARATELAALRAAIMERLLC